MKDKEVHEVTCLFITYHYNHAMLIVTYVRQLLCLVLVMLVKHVMLFKACNENNVAVYATYDNIT